MIEHLFSADALIALLTLTFLEIVLGIDNVIFISIVTGKLPDDQRKRATRLGLFLAMFIRIALLFCISWLVQLKEPWFKRTGAHTIGRGNLPLVQIHSRDSLQGEPYRTYHRFRRS